MTPREPPCMGATRARRHGWAVSLLTIVSVPGCGGNVIISGIYFAPWIACLAAAVVPAYLLTRLFEARLFDYDPRYFAWTFLPLTVIFSVAFWFVFART